jgi:hypothetical protein
MEKPHDNKTTRCAGIQFFLDECIRHATMSQEDQLATIDLFNGSTITHPSGHGLLICGTEALKRIYMVAREALDESQWRDRIEVRRVARELIDLMWARVVGAQPMALSNELADELVKSAIETASRECKSITHFIPCHVVYERVPESFSIGPVLFRHMDSFLAEIGPELQASIPSRAHEVATMRKAWRKEADESHLRSEAVEEAEDFNASAKSYFQQFRWVAVVDISESAKEVSRRQAELCVESALHFLRVSLGAQHSHGIRSDAHPLQPQRGAELARSDGRWSVTLTRSWTEGNSLGDEWWEIVNSGERKCFLEGAGTIVTMLSKFQPMTEISQRLLDAATWFGQAVLDPAPGTKLLKFVAAIERLTIFKKEGSFLERVKRRAGALCCTDECGYASTSKLVEGVYRARSWLAHGQNTPYDPSLEKHSNDAGKLARLGIGQFMRLSIGESLIDPTITPEGLRRGLEKLVALATQEAAA